MLYPEKLSKTVCALPWIHTATDSLGFIRVCCASYHPYGYLGWMNAKTCSPLDTRNHPTLKNIRSEMLKGIEPKACKRCFDRERSGLRSKRQTSFPFFDHLPSIVDNTKEDGTIDPSVFPIEYYDLRVSNKCNSRCIICNSGSSSMWGKLRTWDENLNSKYLQGLIENSKDIKMLHLCGGEPLIIKSYTSLVKKLKGEAHHISLAYNTNFTVLPDEMFDTWKDFRVLKFHISIDGIGDIFEEIRTPTKWATVKNNLEKLESRALPNMENTIVTTLINKNVFHIPDLLRWFIERDYKYIPRIPYFNILHTPQNLSMVNLSDSDRLNIVKKYTKFLEDYQNQGYDQLILPFLDYIKNIDNFSVSPQQYKRRAEVSCRL